MAKDKNTYAKRQRETLKRQKAVEKQGRRRLRKERANDPNAQAEPSDGDNGSDSDSSSVETQLERV